MDRFYAARQVIEVPRDSKIADLLDDADGSHAILRALTIVERGLVEGKLRYAPKAYFLPRCVAGGRPS